MSKEVVLFVLDSNVTMNAPYPLPSSVGNDAIGVVPLRSSLSSSLTMRLSHAKDAILNIIVNWMWKSRQNEVGLIVLRAGITHQSAQEFVLKLEIALVLLAHHLRNKLSKNNP
jgi:hypothetical protein